MTWDPIAVHLYATLIEICALALLIRMSSSSGDRTGKGKTLSTWGQGSPLFEFRLWLTYTPLKQAVFS